LPHERNRDAERLLALAADRSRRARDALSVVGVDLFLPHHHRLTDQQRAIMVALVDKLIAGVELDIRQHLVETLLRDGGRQPDLVALLSDEGVRTAESLREGDGCLRDPALLALVLRRAEEHLLTFAADRDPIAPTTTDVVQALARNPDAELARRAVAYVVAQVRRRDRFQEPLLPRDELPEALAYELHWQVAAVLRRHLLREFVIEPNELDRAVEEAVRRSMADHVEGQGFARRAGRLAARLHELGELSDGFLAQALTQGHPALFATGLAVRARIDLDVAWRAITDRDRHSTLAVARAIGMDRDALASIVRSLDAAQPPARSPAATKALIALYAEIDPAGAQRVLHAWQLDAGYRRAIDEFGGR